MATLLEMSTASGRLLSTLFLRGQQSRAQATDESGLARSAAGTAIAELESLGLLWSLPPEPTLGARGRPSPVIGISAPGAVAIVVEVRRDDLTISGVDLGCTVIWQSTREFDALTGPADDTLARIAAMAEDAIAEHAETRVAGIGLSLPGIVDDETGRAKSVLALEWTDIAAGDIVRSSLKLNVPTIVGHDATLGGLGEFRRGTSSQTPPARLLYLTAQARGLGGALVHTTPIQLAPDLQGVQAGHLVIDPGGRPCSCGSLGCLEQYVNGTLIRTELELPDGASIQDIARRLETDAGEAFSRSTPMRSLEAALVALTNVLSPDQIVLSGSLTPLASRFRDRLMSALQQSVVAQVKPVDLRPAARADAVVLGAAERIFRTLLLDPAGFAQAQHWR